MKVVLLKNNNVSFLYNDLNGYKFKPKKNISSLNIVNVSMLNRILLIKVYKDIDHLIRTIKLILKSDVAIESDCDIMFNEIKRILDKILTKYLEYFSEFEFFDIVKKLYSLYYSIDLKKKIIRCNYE